MLRVLNGPSYTNSVGILCRLFKNTPGWPDIVVGVVIAGLFLDSAFNVIRRTADALWAPVIAPPRT